MAYRLSHWAVLSAFAILGGCGRTAPVQWPATPPSTTVGQVTKVDKRVIMFDLGRDDGLEAGDCVEVAVDGGSLVTRLVRIDRDWSEARTPMGANVKVGAAARYTGAAETVSRLSPTRASYVALEARVSGFPSLADSGGGVFADMRVHYRAPVPIALELRLSPIGLGMGDRGRIGTAHGEFGAAYDHRLFGFGASLGATTMEWWNPGTGSRQTRLVFSAGLNVRLGAIDGLHVVIGTSYGKTPDGFEWVTARVDAGFPLTQGYWLVVSGSGGFLRYGAGTLGIRALLRGTGGPGSLFVSGYFGGGASFTQGVANLYSGPVLGLGLEARY